MFKPFPQMNISFETKNFNNKITNLEDQKVTLYGKLKDVTNYEYELQKNEEKRKILILKSEYLSTFLNDMRNIMKYGKSSQYINDNTKRAYNPKLKGI